MIKMLGGVAVCAFSLSIALPSTAADSDLYVEYSVGASFVFNQDLEAADSSGFNPETMRKLSGDAETQAGFNVGGAFGKRFTEHFRAELAVSFRSNEVEGLSLQNEPDESSGTIEMLAVMANGYIDWDLGIGVIPYVGVGIGWGSLEIEAKNKATPPTDPDNRKARVDGQDSVFAWSLMAGGSYPINEVVDMSLGYRYIATTTADINSSFANLGPSKSRRIEADFDAHEVVMGLRFNF